eukprot:TRINITY_DN41626_c0_g1_i1.p2 TRINITY_DN41626_c0_g1~~TRINITY_DN41626_c0_g1_i1.p2  ORF type:complete len:180 (+),score=44.40 TRINITY_DN41626_c0_g1_i1:84-623(+)
MCIRDSINAEYGKEALGMGICGSQPTESDLKRVRKEYTEELARLKASELLHLTLTSPIECQLQAHALDTVRMLLGLAAVQMGLKERDAQHLTLEFSEQVLDGGCTLEEAGLCQEAAFQVLGPVQEIITARKADILGAAKAGRVEEVAKVCKYCPERANERSMGGFTALHKAAYLSLIHI